LLLEEEILSDYALDTARPNHDGGGYAKERLQSR
jgi:hypothetical protein